MDSIRKFTSSVREQHFNDVIMDTMASEITSLTIVYSTFYSGTDQRKHQSSSSLPFVNSPVTGEFPTQRASNAENVSIWWRHHVPCECAAGFIETIAFGLNEHTIFIVILKWN